jgi:hypothetical protein
MRKVFFAAALVLTSASTVAAQAVNVDRNGVALSGYDAVAYQADGKPVPGSPAITAVHDGATYRFASTAHRDAFVADPGRYLPAYGGYCAFGVSRGYKVKIEPDAFTVLDGKLYLNYDKGVQKQWLQDTQGYIVRADSIWPSIREAPRR